MVGSAWSSWHLVLPPPQTQDDKRAIPLWVPSVRTRGDSFHKNPGSLWIGSGSREELGHFGDFGGPQA